MVRERINIAGVRARWPVSDVTIWRRIRAGDFPAPHYIGTRRYWWADEVESWLTCASQSSSAARLSGR